MKIVGGWVGDKLSDLSEAITTGIYNGFVAIVTTVCDFTLIIAEVGIYFCLIVYIASKDTKSVSDGMKFFLAYIIALAVKSLL